jgi:hypothetical protein
MASVKFGPHNTAWTKMAAPKVMFPKMGFQCVAQKSQIRKMYGGLPVDPDWVPANPCRVHFPKVTEMLSAPPSFRLPPSLLPRVVAFHRWCGVMRVRFEAYHSPFVKQWCCRGLMVEF